MTVSVSVSAAVSIPRLLGGRELLAQLSVVSPERLLLAYSIIHLPVLCATILLLLDLHLALNHLDRCSLTNCARPHVEQGS